MELIITRQTIPNASTLLLPLIRLFSIFWRLRITGLVGLVASGVASLKIRSRKGISMPSEMIENNIERIIKRQYRNISFLF